jgi:hypothetical protein
LADAFGLSPFISPPVIRQSSMLSQDWYHSGPGDNPSGKKFTFPRPLKWAAFFTIPIGVAAVIGLAHYDTLSTGLANNAGILSSVFTRYYSASLVEKKKAPVTARVKVLQAVVASTPATQAVTDPLNIRHDDRFAVIVGAFRVQENAEKLIKELQGKGITASVFDQSKTGLFRVTIGTSSDRDHAKKMLASAKSTDFDGAWILEK